VSSLGPYKITIVDLRAQHGKIRDEVRMAIDEVTDSQQFILGPVVKRFEEQMTQHLQCGFAIAVGSGSDALLNLLRATYCITALSCCDRRSKNALSKTFKPSFAVEPCFHLSGPCGKNFHPFSVERSWLNLKR
jgi:hypothetical protein